MLYLKDTRHASTAAFLESAMRIAGFYGFLPIDTIPLKQSHEIKSMRERAAKNETAIAFARREERMLVSAAKRCAACARINEPLLAWRISDTGRDRDDTPTTTFELHVVGNASAVSEALLIAVADAIVRAAGISTRILHINSIGSPESSNRFVRDVGSYLRKHLESISATLRPRAAIDPLGTLVTLIERGHPAIPRAPQAAEYLIEEERQRFWNVLEYLEVAGLPYELSPHVLGSRDCWEHSLYQISSINKSTGARTPIAFGGRYDPLASRYAAAALPAATIAIACETRGTVEIETSERNTTPTPSMYFAHLGAEARRRSLSVMEKLREQGIAIHQGLVYERLGDQMAIAQRLAVPYILIMGHKEAAENTIIVREVATNYQESVPLPDLPSYLKRHRFVNTSPALA